MDAWRAEEFSSSSIPIPPQWVYDVFVSFRGVDTRKNFTSHLFTALEDNGFRTFRDDKELERGEFISDGLLKAIEGSRMSLIVFSKDYAGSRWCLDELVRIMDCRETLKQIVVPIFYDVVPSDVRKQTGVLQEAFAEHEKCFREGSDGKVKKWRAALTDVATLSGRHLLNEANGDEAELIKMIIKDVREKGTEAVQGLILNATNVQMNAKPFEKMDKLWYRVHVLEVRRDGMILDKLKFLYLNNCHYLTRTPDFSKLYSLEELWLNDCKSLVEVDESIRCLKKLLVLDMKNCTKLRKLPSGIWMLKSLERLDLSGCSKLGDLAVFKGPLYKLWCLFFSSLTLPAKAVDSIGFSLTPSQASSCLKELNLEDCHLSYLPDEIGNLISLRTLNLTQNKLSTLPDCICNLTCLKHLHLDNNNVSHLPSGIGRLTSLEILNLARNCLCTLPHTIARDEEVPIWFPYRGRGRNVYFVVPPSPSVKQKILGWILRVLISWAPREASHLFPKLYIQEVICNKIKKQGLSHHFCVCTGVDNVWLMYIPQGYAGLQLEGGDEAEIPIDEYSETLVKNWAIDLIYEADEIDMGNDTLYQVVSI
ncbi:hypothetical protein RHMOL_Rhmol01G0089300 [Rhododendron molle]|uniref:Uncharacterized protein n=1 Tax=Rhododendron molle TaxID=49168 RepID=A0ACC0Q0X8_RHOML|nr:hypothetical protein RHMOL_Rhmol01G0089300 [Rhododendron molle]